MSAYFEALCAAMNKLSENPKAIFIGQSLLHGGTAMARTMRDVPRSQIFEVPVFENAQLGIAIGMALGGALPVCCFPRINFLLEATSQLVQHLDKIPHYSAYRPKVIVRTAIASSAPLDPGPQHVGDYSGALDQMFGEIALVRVVDPRREYAWAAADGRSSLLVEDLGAYE